MKGKYAKVYVLSTQGILNMVVFMVIGYFIGYFIGYLIDKKSFWPPLLAAVGVLCGLVTFISYLLFLLKEDDKLHEKPKD